MEQELPLQNWFFCKFQGFQGKPRFFHITPLQNGSLYFWGLALFQVAILLKCVLMSGSPLCRGQWFWKSQKCTKKRGWVPWFCRENLLLDLWQVPHSVEAWGPKSQIWLYKMATQPPPGHLLGVSEYFPVLLRTTKLAQSTSQDKACTKYFPGLLHTTKLAQSTSQYNFVLQSLRKVLPSTTWYYKACTKYFPGLLRTTKLAQSTSQYYFVLQSLHPSTTSYYKACTKHFPVLVPTTKLAQSTSQYYFVLQSLHKVLFVLQSLHPSTTSYYKACTKYFPVLLRTAELAQYFPGLLRTTKLAQRKRRVSFDFYIPKIALTTRRCRHSNANCKPGSPHTMAQRIESLKDHLRAALTMGTTRAPNDRSRTRRTNQAPPVNAGSHFMRENTGVRSVSTSFGARVVPIVSAARRWSLKDITRCAIAFGQAASHWNGCSDASSRWCLGVMLEAAPVAQTRLPPTPGATLCEKQRVSFDFEHPNISLTTRRCSHSNANCKPGWPNTMAQRIESFKDHLRAALTMGTTRAPNQVEAAPVAQTRFPQSTPGATLCEENGFVRFLTPKHHLDDASLQPFQCKLPAKRNGTARWIFQRSPPRSAGNGDHPSAKW